MVMTYLEYKHRYPIASVMKCPDVGDYVIGLGYVAAANEGVCTLRPFVEGDSTLQEPGHTRQLSRMRQFWCKPISPPSTRWKWQW